MPNIILRMVFTFLCVLQIGCSWTDKLGRENFMVAPLTKTTTQKELEGIYTNLTVLSDRVSQLPTDEERVLYRDRVVRDLLRLSDAKYAEFKTLIYSNHGLMDTSVDLASIGMSAAATLVGGPAAQALS